MRGHDIDFQAAQFKTSIRAQPRPAGIKDIRYSMTSEPSLVGLTVAFGHVAHLAYCCRPRNATFGDLGTVSCSLCPSESIWSHTVAVLDTLTAQPQLCLHATEIGQPCLTQLTCRGQVQHKRLQISACSVHNVQLYNSARISTVLKQG